jgi:hypothetical protein
MARAAFGDVHSIEHVRRGGRLVHELNAAVAEG